MQHTPGTPASLCARISLIVSALVIATAVPAFATVLHSGDKVQVTVYNHPDLSGPQTIDGSGAVSLPLAGSVSVAGADAATLARRIRASLARYITNVAVDVQLIAQNQSIFVAGGPGGSITYVPGETLLTALAQIQSPPLTSSVLTPATTQAHDLLHGRVDLRKVSVERDAAMLGPFDIDALQSAGSAGPVLLPGDTIHFVDKPVRVLVQGEVKEPGYTYLTESQPVSDAVTQVGGPLDTATVSSITLRRDGVDQKVAIGRPPFTDPAQPGDTIVVGRAPTVSVIGDVVKPGQTTLRGTPNLIAAVYEAGGPQKDADIKHVALIHDGKRVEYDLNGVAHGTDPSRDNPTLVDGDSVIVPIGHKMDLSSVWQALVAARLLFP